MGRDHGNLQLVAAPPWLEESHSESSHETQSRPFHEGTEVEDAALREAVSRALATVQAQQRGSSGPRVVHVRNFRSDRYRLRDELAVSIEDAGPTYAAVSYDTGQFGEGPSPEDAIESLCHRLEAYYEMLRDDRERLGRQPMQHLVYLEAVLAPLE